MVRGAWSESFRAPTFDELFLTNPLPDFFATFPFLPFFDPLAPGGPALVFTGLVNRGNPDLRPETSSQWDFSVAITPESLPELDVSASYSYIDYEDRIVSGGFIVRDVSAELVAMRSDVIIRDSDGNAITQDWSPVNAYRRVSEDLELDISYLFETRLGRFEPGIKLIRVLRLEDQYAADLEPIDLVGTSKGLDDYRLRGRLSWSHENWSALLGVNYSPSYVNNQVSIVFGSVQAFHKVDSHTTIDLTVAAELGNGLSLRAGGRNITDASFPFASMARQIAGGRPYDPSRVDPYGRVLFLDVEQTFD